MKDGSYSPLFINKKSRIPVGEWLESEYHPTKGFAGRQGWHCTLEPVAPHLAENPKNDVQRVWVEVEVEDYELYDRPESQGGTWVLAQKMKIIGEMSKPTTKIRHQMFFKGKKGDKLLMEQFMEWKVPEDKVKNDVITQLGLMNWEEDEFLKKNIIIKRQILDDDEWEKLTSKN